MPATTCDRPAHHFGPCARTGADHGHALCGLNVGPIPLDRSRTRQYKNWRGTRMETWEAVSADGKWTFERIEDTGTPWEVRHADFPEWHSIFGSLPKARKGAELALSADLHYLARTGKDRYGRKVVQGA